MNISPNIAHIIKQNVKPKRKRVIRLKKTKIPRALREQVWLISVGKLYEKKCIIDWCNNMMNVFDFHVGHNIPESKGGSTTIENLKPICSRCNSSMSNNYSIEEWSKMGKETNKESGKESGKDSGKKHPVKPCCICC